MSTHTWVAGSTTTSSSATASYVVRLDSVKAPAGYHYRHVRGKPYLVRNPKPRRAD